LKKYILKYRTLYGSLNFSFSFVKDIFQAIESLTRAWTIVQCFKNIASLSQIAEITPLFKSHCLA
jgi:hypothetical protein